MYVVKCLRKLTMHPTFQYLKIFHRGRSQQLDFDKLIFVKSNISDRFMFTEIKK